MVYKSERHRLNERERERELYCPQGVSRSRGDCSRQPSGPQQALDNVFK